MSHRVGSRSGSPAAESADNSPPRRLTSSGESARARYDWFYLANPAGPSRVYLLFSGDEMVGALGAGTRQLAGASAFNRLPGGSWSGVSSQ